MAMKNPYAAYQKFSKKNPPIEGTAPTKTAPAEPSHTAVQVGEEEGKETMPLSPAKEGFQPSRPKPQNPKLYEMKKTVVLPEEKPKAAGEKEAAKPKPANPYLQSKVMTATPEELVLMLYDGAIRFMNVTVAHLEKGEKEAAHQSSLRAQAIVAELMGGLNMDFEVSANLFSLYEYLQYVMVNANIDKDVEQSQQAIEMLREMRETWQEAMKRHRAGN